MKRRMLVSMFLVVVFVLSMAGTALAQPEQSTPWEIDYQSAVQNADGSITYDVLNAEELASHFDIDSPQKC